MTKRERAVEVFTNIIRRLEQWQHVHAEIAEPYSYEINTAKSDLIRILLNIEEGV